MESEAAKRNAEALATLSQGNFIGTQQILQENAKRYPGHQTYNNLGYYYCTEGLEMKNGQVRSAVKLGIQYLQKAEKIQETPLNLTNLGEAYFKNAQYQSHLKEDYEKALAYYTRANEMEAASWRLYNMAACLWKLGRYDRAYMALGQLHENYSKESILKGCGRRAVMPFALLFIQCHEPEQKTSFLKDPLITDNTEEELDVLERFIIYYFCADLERAAQLSEEILNKWEPDPPELAMIIDCFIRKKKFQEVSALIQYVSEHYSVKNRLLRKLVREPAFRTQTIKSFHYEMNIAYTCGFYGCLKHNAPGFSQL